ncbi:tyrosine-type recombinase/integrase [Spiractinospora alimapuensis]|uniref:tyrosine-type recombinase/integrase n=1 Tax=Spiractinospora alimapuensis TaxID=2820884 RepID=UPI001F340849|nr:tyrosine-type recombinase/integrase [Spiractinospora alimapuensis]QVQ52578.1 tyrosine-type recombinase/integrase [Spiractinospora alimapuensis]
MSTEPGTDLLPLEVRTRLAQSDTAFLVDTEALHTVRSRFDDSQAASLARYLSAAQSENTLRAYRTDWITFAAWCVTQRRQSLPADPVDVAVFLAGVADQRDPDGGWALSVATVERRSAAIAAVHAAHGVASPSRSDVVRLTLRGVRRQRRGSPRRKRPVVLSTLEAMLAVRPEPGFPTGVARARDTLLLLAGFAGALRRGELVGLTVADVEVGTDPATLDPLVVLHLGATKTDPQARNEHRVVLPRGRAVATCPVCALAVWIPILAAHHRGADTAVRAAVGEHREGTGHVCGDLAAAHASGSGPLAELPPTQPLFVAVNRHGHVAGRAMTGRAVGDLVKRYAQRAGLDADAYGGHSLRAGFATQAALAGAADREIMRQGRWSTPRTVHGYIRSANPLDDNAVTQLGL